MFLKCSYFFQNLSLDVLINKVLIQSNACSYLIDIIHSSQLTDQLFNSFIHLSIYVFHLFIRLNSLISLALLRIVMFIFAIIGMNSFGHVKLNGSLDDTVNFQTFGSSMVLLFRLATAAGWNDVLDGLLIAVRTGFFLLQTKDSIRLSVCLSLGFLLING